MFRTSICENIRLGHFYARSGHFYANKCICNNKICLGHLYAKVYVQDISVHKRTFLLIDVLYILCCYTVYVSETYFA